jgi:hypothetical protein
VQLQDGKGVWLRRDRVLDVFGVFVEDVLAARDYFREDREAVAGRGLGKDGPVTPLLDLVLEVPSLGIAIAAGFDQSCVLDSLDIELPLPWCVSSTNEFVVVDRFYCWRRPRPGKKIRAEPLGAMHMVRQVRED